MAYWFQTLMSQNHESGSPGTRLQELDTLVRVVDAGSFAAAARALGLSPSALSKRVGQLEQALGVRLLQRTTRSLALTEAGRSAVERGRALLAELEQLEAELTGRRHEARGTLRVSAPIDFGRLVLAGPLARFAAEQPALGLELEFSDRLVDVVEEGFDAVVRIAPRHDSGLVMRRLARCWLVACASPAYLEERGEPRRVADLGEHDCIGYTLQRRWRFRERGRRRSVLPRTRLATNAGWSERALALEGLGIALLPSFLVAEDLAAGRLRSVLAESLDADLQVAVLYPARRGAEAKLRRFVDFLAAHVGAAPGCESTRETPPRAAGPAARSRILRARRRA